MRRSVEDQRHPGEKVMRKAEIAVKHLQAKNTKIDDNYQKLGRGRNIFPEKLQRQHSPCQYLDLGLLASRTETIHFCWFKPHSLWSFVLAAQKTNTPANTYIGDLYKAATLYSSRGHHLLYIPCALGLFHSHNNVNDIPLGLCRTAAFFMEERECSTS